MEKFNATDETIDLIEDYLQEYIDKYILVDEDIFFEFQNNDHRTDFSRRFTYKGYYKIRKVSTNLFKVDGFPDGKKGYLVKISLIIRPNESEWKDDMFKFIKRVCISGFKYETGIDRLTYYIAFFK